MEPRGCQAGQANAPLRSSSILQTAHSTYHPRPSPYIHHDNVRTMARSVSLPHMHVNMYSTEGSTDDACHIKGTTAITSMRRQRSVTGMKRLLPLKLLPKCPGQDWPSHHSMRRVTFELPVVHSDGRNILERRGSRTFIPPPMTIRPEKYRDTPIYTEAGSPLLGRAYYTDDDTCFTCSPGSSCDETCIFQDYETSSDESSEAGDWFGSLPGDFGDSPSASSTGEKGLPRTSDWSFKCRGEPHSHATPLYRDEAAWLSSSSPPRPTTTVRSMIAEIKSPRRDSEAWLDDSSSCDGDDEVVACATVLTPSKAHVVDVNRISGVTLTIPPRSSSFAGTRPEPLFPDCGRKSRMSFREGSQADPMDYYSDSWHTDDDATPRPRQFQKYRPPTPPAGRYDYVPPPSAKTMPERSLSLELPIPVRRSLPAMDLHRVTSFRTYPTEFFTQSVTNPDPIHKIISALEEAASSSLPTLFQPTVPCILTIRTYAHALSTPQQTSPPSSRRSSSVSKTIHPNAISRRRTTSFLRHTQNGQLSICDPVPPLPPPPQSDYPPIPNLASSASSPFTAITPPMSHLRSSILGPQSEEPNLQPLRNIFPTASEKLLGSLYAHVLAYNFLATLPTQHQHQPHAVLPFKTTTSHAIPPKVALLLGAPPLSALPPTRKVENAMGVFKTSEGGEARIEQLQERIRNGIAWVLGEVNGDGGREGGNVDEVVLRALGEVVRGCDR